MTSLLEVKKQIKGVKSTRKITKAMQLVAASKMRQFQRRALGSRSYVWDLFQVLQANHDERVQSVYTEERKTGKTLFVLYTSDKGLCGPLNTKLINSLVRGKRWKGLPEDQRLLMTIGKKSHDYAVNNGIPIVKSALGIPEKLTALDAINVVDSILELWNEGNVKEVIFITPHYKNSFTFYPVMKTFLPFSEKTVELALGPLNDEDRPTVAFSANRSMIYEPSPEVVVQRLYEQLIQAMFIQSFLELKAAEYSSRMIAMQNATDAADGMIEDLTRVYNKARQAAITQEIAELIGASMAMEDAK
jgi:F-type H+-transporting ATPase subunit gamma